MDISRLPGEKSNRYDQGFPVALDGKLQRVSAQEAIRRRKQGENIVYYCPKCYELDPQNKVIVIPNDHKNPRFHRLKGESHSVTCQYKNPVKFMSHITRKMDIKFDSGKKTMQLAIMPYEGRGLAYESLDSRLRIHQQLDNKKFMLFVENILSDYEIEQFYRN